MAAGSAESGWLFANRPDPECPELEPIGTAADTAGAALIEAHADLVAGGRSLAAPPGLSDERLGCLRQAFDKAVNSAALLDEADAISRPISALSGAELSAMIENLVADAPDAYVELLRKSYSN